MNCLKLNQSERIVKKILAVCLMMGFMFVSVSSFAVPAIGCTPGGPSPLYQKSSEPMSGSCSCNTGIAAKPIAPGSWKCDEGYDAYSCVCIL